MSQMNTIMFDDFMKVDVRAGKIGEVEKVPKSELLRMQVDFGDLGIRQVLARIATSYEPSQLTGLTAAFVVNLPPRIMKGFESSAMVLAAETNELSRGHVALTTLPMTVKPGTRIG